MSAIVGTYYTGRIDMTDQEPDNLQALVDALVAELARVRAEHEAEREKWITYNMWLRGELAKRIAELNELAAQLSSKAQQ
jgi:hypothetical protein